MRFYNGESRRHQKYALKPWQRALKRLSLGGKAAPFDDRAGIVGPKTSDSFGSGASQPE